jgi:hypothetical protein
MGVDALAGLSVLPQVEAACEVARGEVDALLWRRDVRAAAAEVAADSRARGARDSAAIDGADVAVIDDSPMGRVLAASERHKRVHGEALLTELLHFYSTVVGLFKRGNLGGVRYIARKAQ